MYVYVLVVVKFSLGSGGDDDLCNDKGLNNRQGQVCNSYSALSVRYGTNTARVPKA